MFYLSLGIFLFVFIASLIFRGRFFWPKFVRLSFYLSFLAVFIFLLGLSAAQFFEWRGDDFSKYLLPPHQTINYFLFYCFNRFFLQYLISAAVAFIFLFAADFFNKKYGGRFFENEEPYLSAFAIFLAGWPGLLVYAVFLITSYFLMHLFSLLAVKGFSRRLSAYYLWLTVGIFVIIINNFMIQNLPFWQMLKI